MSTALTEIRDQADRLNQVEMTHQRAYQGAELTQVAAKLSLDRATLAAPRSTLARRLCFVIPVLALPALGLTLALHLTAHVPGLLKPVLLLLLFANLLYLAVTGWPGVLGAIVRLVGRRRLLSASCGGESATAILFPVYNEEPNAVFTAASVMMQALVERGVERTDIFVLSDTRDPAIADREEAAFARLQSRFGDRVRYRRRTENHRRKVGNIADFCRRWGSEYDYMIVLDADSLMGAATVTTLIGAMDANPRAGLIQTVPYAVGRETLFARIQQFAARLYTPLLVDGLAFWQVHAGNYWGHNAIIRIAPFMEHCELPVLPGREPWGGEILCHDVVEAAMMRRGGWDVWLLPALGESYEALPANMVDFAQRERRWCQGNLQHTGVISMPGLHAVGRYHLALGIFTYLSGPLFVAFAMLATLDGVCGGGFAEALFGTGRGASAFLALTGFLLYGAKLCSLAATLVSSAESAKFGGRIKLLASAVLEQLAAMVSAPILLLFYTRFQIDMLLGRSVRWDAQPRDDRGVGWAEAARRMRLPALTGLVWLAALCLIGGRPLEWSLTLVPGLLLAIPASVWTSLTSLGRAARRAGLFLTEDEVAASPILRAYNRAYGREADAVWAQPLLQVGFLQPAGEGDAS